MLPVVRYTVTDYFWEFKWSVSPAIPGLHGIIYTPGGTAGWQAMPTSGTWVDPYPDAANGLYTFFFATDALGGAGRNRFPVAQTLTWSRPLD